MIELDGKAAGFCKIDRKDGQGKVDYLMVLEAYRGRGFGRELMDWAMEAFEEEKISLIEVKVVEGNPTIHLYEKYGFRVNAQLMWKENDADFCEHRNKNGSYRRNHFICKKI